MPNYVPGMGPSAAKIVFVGEAPGADEDEAGKPFIGPSGKELHELCADAGHPNWRDEVYVTNVSKYRPPNNDFSRLSEVTDYKREVAALWDEIHAIRPNVILALGDIALTAVSGKTGITKYRGSIIQSIDGIPKVVSTFHPANLVRSGTNSYGEEGKGIFKYAYRNVMIDDIRRAFEESQYPELKTPDRLLRIARGSYDVYDFIRRNQGRMPVIDIEAYHCIPTCLALAFDRFESLSIPLFRKIGRGLTLCDWTLTDISHSWNMLDGLFRSVPVIGHNIKYDVDKLMMLGFRFLKIHADTMMLAHTVNPEMPSFKLQFLTSTLTREPYYKDEGGEFNPKKDRVDRLFLYNAKDAAVTYEVYEELDKELDYLSDTYGISLRPFFYDYVMRLLPLYLRMENRGLRVDDMERERIRFKYEKWHEEIQQRFVEALGHEINVNSSPQMHYTLYDELRCPKRKDCSEDTIAALIQNNIKDERRKRILSDILDDRRVRKTLGTYIESKSDFDGRIRTSYRICGTETGRSSTGILKPPLRPYKQGMAFQTITKHGDIGADIREYLVPDEGKVFVSVDKSQAEARVVAVLSKDWELLNGFDKVDIHRRTAALVFDYTDYLDLSPVCKVADIIGKDSPERFIGKKTRHAGNYNMGKHRFMTEVTADAKKFNIDIALSEWKAGKILDKFHMASPKIREIFHNDIRREIDERRVLINPFGRFRMFFDRVGEDLYKESFAYIPQSTVHDSLTRAWIEIDSQKSDIDWLMESHDALLFQCRLDEVVDICTLIKREFERPISFRGCSLQRDIDLVIPSDIEIGYTNLREMTKFKLEERAA